MTQMCILVSCIPCMYTGYVYVSHEMVESYESYVYIRYVYTICINHLVYTRYVYTVCMNNMCIHDMYTHITHRNLCMCIHDMYVYTCYSQESWCVYTICMNNMCIHDMYVYTYYSQESLYANTQSMCIQILFIGIFVSVYISCRHVLLVEASILSVCRMQCVVVCCGVLQCVVVCCGGLQCVAVCCGVLRCVAVCCSVLRCVAVIVQSQNQKEETCHPFESVTSHIQRSHHHYVSHRTCESCHTQE